MKYSLDTYRLYQDENRFSHVIRVKVTMKEAVDGDILKKSVNTALTRYPYFAVQIVQFPLRLTLHYGRELLDDKRALHRCIAGPLELIT